MLNNSVVDKWVAALESGEYQQGTGQLKNGDKYCCLGVLCDIYLKEGNVGWWNENYFETPSNTFLKVPSTSVTDWLGVYKQDPVLFFGISTGSVLCSTANDKLGMTFKEIAEKIKQWPIDESQSNDQIENTE